MTAGEIFLTALLIITFIGNMFASGALFIAVLHKRDRDEK